MLASALIEGCKVDSESDSDGAADSSEESSGELEALKDNSFRHNEGKA